MEIRRDPWRALTPIVEGIFGIAQARGPWGRATFGDVKALPGARNTVPEKLVLTVDIRHPDTATLEDMVREMHDLIARNAAANGIEAHVEQVWYMPPTAFDARLIEQVTKSADELGYSAREIVSGAGHDSLHTAQFAPTAMIFIPCASGISHNELEWAEPDDLSAGADVLLHAVLALANDQETA
jgi:N-carbamoyl-L-amino-acid hydrolase